MEGPAPRDGTAAAPRGRRSWRARAAAAAPLVEVRAVRAQPPRAVPERHLRIPLGGGAGTLEAALVVPERARGVVLLAHGTVPCRRCPCDMAVARAIERRGFATLIVDLLTAPEADEDARTGRYSVDVERFAARVAVATRRLSTSTDTRDLRVGFYGAGTGAPAALLAAAALAGVGAVVSCGGRVDLLGGAALARVGAPVLLVEGTNEGGLRAREKDERIRAMCRGALRWLPCARAAIVRGATHWPRDPEACAAVADLAAGWFERHLAVAPPRRRHPSTSSPSAPSP